MRPPAPETSSEIPQISGPNTGGLKGGVVDYAQEGSVSKSGISGKENIVKKTKMEKRFGLIGTSLVAISALIGGVAHADGHLLFPIGEGEFSWDSYHAFAKEHDYSGQQLTIFGPWAGLDEEIFENVIAYFEEATGADVRYRGTGGGVAEIFIVDAEAGTSANISIFPLPGFAADMAKRGFLTKLDPDTAGWIRDNYAAGQSYADLGTYAGPDGNKALYGFPYEQQVKSLVWYSPENFEDAGYEVPQSMEDLKALNDQIVADGGTPWCIGLASGAATGWPASDWVEDMLLRTQPPELYDQWVRNEIPFDDPRIVAAIEEFGAFARNDKYVAGGASQVAAGDWKDSPKGLFDSPPQCYMHRAATYITSFFPEGTVVGEDVDFFYFPAWADKDLGKPVLGGGGFFSISNESPAAHGFIEFLKTPIAHEAKMAQGAFLTAYKDVSKAVFRDRTQAMQNEILFDATTFRFDGSDLMPGAVASAFWKGTVDYVGGKDAAAVARDIQESWDAIK